MSGLAGYIKVPERKMDNTNVKKTDVVPRQESEVIEPSQQ